MNALCKPIAACLLICGLSPSLLRAQTSYGPYQVDSGADRVVVIEAEAWHRSTAGATNTWERVEDINASGGLAVSALPDIGESNNSDYLTESPALHYDIEFPEAATYYAVVLGRSPDGSGDSVHLGLNGQAEADADRIGSFSRSYEWEEDTFDGNLATFSVPSAGLHTLDLWMREDGMVVDKLVLSVNTNFLPRGFGPPTSAQTGKPAEGSNESEFRILSAVMQEGELIAAFTPKAGVERYRIARGTSPDTNNTEDVTAGLDSFQALVDADTDLGMIHIEPVSLPETISYAAALAQRAAYGPTPDMVSNLINANDPTLVSNWLNTQLAPETITETADARQDISDLEVLIQQTRAYPWDLQAWHFLRAVHADRQLLEVLLQFFNNHFVTYVWKTRNYFRDQGYSNDDAMFLASLLEYRELEKWRQILLDPNGTFYDLLRVSCESPAMIIFLDTVENDQSNPNENFSRELFELFTMGVDNGYEQEDIEEMAKAWTGWTVRQVNAEDVDNPFAGPVISNQLVEANAQWMYRKGNSPIETNWYEAGYITDTNWTNGITSIGYGDNDDLTVLDDMRYNYTTVFFRKEVHVVDPSVFDAATLRHYSDDGFVLYANGNEVFRYNADGLGVPAYDDRSVGSVNNASWISTTIDLSGFLQPGTNLLAAVGLNTSSGSSDFSFDLELWPGLPPTWGFVFDEAAHDPTNKVLFSEYIIDARFGAAGNLPYELSLPMRVSTNGIQDGYDIIAHLADLPYTQEYVIIKLCQLFVHEDFSFPNYYNVNIASPELDLVKDCMNAWSTPAPGDGRRGNIRQVVRTILESDLFRSQSAVRQKVKNPMEYTVSAIRALRLNDATASTDGYDLLRPSDRMGMEPFANFSPDGWPETGDEWIDTSTLLERIRFAHNFLRRADDDDKDLDYGYGYDDNLSDPVALITAALPANELNDASAVAAYFLGLLFPGCGMDNLHQEYAESLLLLNSDETGTPDSSPFSTLSPGTLDHDQRVRSLVGLLLASPRFQEQ